MFRVFMRHVVRLSQIFIATGFILLKGLFAKRFSSDMVFHLKACSNTRDAPSISNIKSVYICSIIALFHVLSTTNSMLRKLNPTFRMFLHLIHVYSVGLLIPVSTFSWLPQLPDGQLPHFQNHNHIVFLISGFYMSLFIQGSYKCLKGFLFCCFF